MTRKDWETIEEVIKAAGTYRPDLPATLPPSISSAEWMRRRIAVMLTDAFGKPSLALETEPKGLGCNR